MGEFWWTVDADMFTYVMKSKIEELIDEKLNQEFPSEVETRDKQDFENDEDRPQKQKTHDDSETNNTIANNCLDSAIMATNLEPTMKLAEEED